MCGMACILNGRPISAAGVETVLAARGPDGRGELCDGHAWFLHRRLSVIDTSESSAQPFTGAPAGMTTVYNGEIYNYKELGPNLEPLSTDGDTEVFSRLLASGTLDPAKGMYAGVAVNGPVAVAARDRFGIKPLYVAHDGDRLAFLSQVRCFAPMIGPTKINEDAVASFLRFGSVVGQTIVDGVEEFPTATVRRYEDGQIVSERRLRDCEPVPLARALRSSVERHLVADVPVAVLLSGGLDSAVVAKLAAESGEDIEAVTLSPGGELDEADRARRTARHYGVRHRVQPVDLSNLDAVIGDFFDAMDQPSIDGFNTYLVSKAVREAGYKVALTGLGADELFGGYASFRRAYLAHALRRVPASSLAALVERCRANEAKAARWLDSRWSLTALALISREVFSPDEVEQMCGTIPATPPTYETLGDDVSDVELWAYMAPMLLRDSDTFSMAQSVELRVPFLDDDVVGAAKRRPLLARATLGKRTIALALRDPYLLEVALGRKTGFRLPFDDWLEGPLEPRVDAALSPSSSLAGILDLHAARSLCAEGPWSRKWALIALNEWLSRHG